MSRFLLRSKVSVNLKKKKSLKFTIGMNGAGTWLIGLNGTNTSLFTFIIAKSFYKNIFNEN